VGSSLRLWEYEGFCLLLGDRQKKLESLYRASVHGSAYRDLLRLVGNKINLIVLIRKDRYVFGAYTSKGLQPPADATGSNLYRCNVWPYSMIGHFGKVTKIFIPRKHQLVYVDGQSGAAGGVAHIKIGDYVADHFLWLGYDGQGNGAAADIRSCGQRSARQYVPDGFRGKRDDKGRALFGGSELFVADELEILHAF